MVKVAIGTLVNSFAALGEFINTTKIPADKALVIARNIKEVQKEITTFEQERNKLAERISGGEKEKKDDGEMYVFKTPEQQREWTKEFTALIGAEIELSIQKISTAGLPDIEPAKILPFEYMFE